MKETVYLVVNAQTGESRVRKTPTAGPNDYVFRINLEIPDTRVPVVTIKIPVPAAPAVVTEIQNIPFGVPWAISEGIVKVMGLSDEGAVILSYTDEGLARLFQEANAKGKERWEIYEYARKRWGLPTIYIEEERLEKLEA